MLIEFHGDNKLLSEFVVIMGDRSNNAILKGVLLSWPLKWKGVRYDYRMVFVMIWKYASSLFIFARTNSDQIYLASSQSTLENADSKQRKVCKSCACRMFFFNKRKCFSPSKPGDWSKFCEQKQSSIREIFASSLSKGQYFVSTWMGPFAQYRFCYY